MTVHCAKCSTYLDDEFRTTICPHEPFLANDGKNNFTKHENSYRGKVKPNVGYEIDRINEND